MTDAATIAVVGVAVVMAALTILMIAIMVITRLVPGSKEAQTNATPEEIQDVSPEKKSVAAIAVAMALAMEAEGKASAFGGAPTGAPGEAVSRWASAGREQLMHSRSKTGRKWGRPSG
jgi:Na+-transporting methylmalonyl-CoA/oxaloacetate decarboxylase gamma subunit